MNHAMQLYLEELEAAVDRECRICMGDIDFGDYPLGSCSVMSYDLPSHGARVYTRGARQGAGEKHGPEHPRLIPPSNTSDFAEMVGNSHLGDLGTSSGSYRLLGQRHDRCGGRDDPR